MKLIHLVAIGIVLITQTIMSNHENELYIEARYEEYLKEGYTPTVALEYALRDFNNLENDESEHE
jgi:hypothetical protein